MRHIKAKFNSKCAETGAQIKKGDNMLYDPNTKKCYSKISDTCRKFLDDSENIQDPGEQYFDNFCQRNNI
jgi:hypothetical protein